MKWRQFIAKAEALGFHCEVIVLANDFMTRMLVINRKGDKVAEIEDMSAYNYDVRYWWDGSTLYDSEEQHRQLVLLVQQMGNTKVQNRGILPADVSRRKFEAVHEVTI